ncbi:MAG TPA: PEGA domain-containing protein [Caldithrix abyssi]|uniref:PEGA domain-containing protein n=1 Tax=Caldithrix abyssi TaxID=187145 RepID=A0A7V5PNP9_CALAY|nr:PEGA domain-containing protein [Caldithrix abyssi]
MSCATILSKSSYPVTINSQPDGATITITDQNGVKVYEGSTPTTVTLKAGAGFFKGASYTVSFQKPGYAAQTITISKELDMWYIGNLVFGGLIGLLIVDPLTGAMWKLPSNVNATLVRSSTSLNIDGQQLRMVLLDDVPLELRSKLIPVK